MLIILSDFLILGDRLTQRLDDTTLTAEDKYPINFTQPKKRFILSLRYNGINSFLSVVATKIYQLKATGSEIKDYTLCLGNILKDFTINNMSKTGSGGVVSLISVDFNPIDINDFLDILKHLIKRT